MRRLSQACSFFIFLSFLDGPWAGPRYSEKVFMRAQEPIQIGDGETYLVIVQGDRVVNYTWAMMPHIEFVKRTVGELPKDAWVGTISKIDGELAVISSKTFYGVQMPAPEWVTRTVKAMFR